ncbi:hypothetical protein Tco_0493449 [Tanacetum coccineum]
MVIDKSWTCLWRSEKAFYTGLKAFVEHYRSLVNSFGNVKCLCKSCRNVPLVAIDNLSRHITNSGWDPSYKTWTHHGEPDLPPPVIHNTTQPQMSDMTACLNDLSYIPPNNEQNEPTQGDIGETSNEPTQAIRNEFEELYASANEELYPGCDYVTRLDFMAKFTHFKVKGKLTDSIFNEMLEFFQFVFKGYKLPSSYYAIKKTFKMIGLGYESIHACVNDCYLFRGEDNKDKQFCPVCNTSRWKDNHTTGKKVPKKVLRYFPIIPRLQRLYKSSHTTKEMTWHATGKCTEPGKMQHPVDGRAWKKFDTRYPKFAAEPRNVRLGLAADGFNLFGNLSQSYSMWPVIWKTTYNLPRGTQRRSCDFNGETEDGDPPREFNPDQILTQLNRLPTHEKGKHPSYRGAKIKRNVLVELNWTKRSIFYELNPEIDMYLAKFKSCDKHRTTQNSGICSPDEKDEEMYYGQLEEILEFSYMSFKVVLFRVKWFDTSNNRCKHQCFVIRNNITQIWAHGGPMKIRFEFSDRGTLMPLGDHVAHWSNLLGEIAREFPMHYPAWRKIESERKAGFIGLIRVAKPDGTYDVEVIRSRRPANISWADWDAHIRFWLGPKNAARATQNRLNRAKSTIICRQGSRSLAALRDQMSTRKPNRGGRKASILDTRRPTRNLGLRSITDKSGPMKIRFEFSDRGTLMPLGDHAAHWSNLLGEIAREFPMHYPAWRKIESERKAGFMGLIRIRFWLDPKNVARAAQNRLNRAKSTIICRQGSRSLDALRDQMMESSATREYPSLIRTYFDMHTVDGVFVRDEERILYEEMLRLQDLGSNTPSRVLAGKGTNVPIMPEPRCKHTADVDQVGSDGGSGGGGDDESGEDEDADDHEDAKRDEDS